VDWTDANYLDSLALAQHMTGDTAAAVATQQRAIELAPDNDKLKATLSTYESALEQQTEGDPSP
jgi:Flp pilus assembly protein TadD